MFQLRGPARTHDLRNREWVGIHETTLTLAWSVRSSQICVAEYAKARSRGVMPTASECRDDNRCPPEVCTPPRSSQSLQCEEVCCPHESERRPHSHCRPGVCTRLSSVGHFAPDTRSAPTCDVSARRTELLLYSKRKKSRVFCWGGGVVFKALRKRNVTGFCNKRRDNKKPNRQNHNCIKKSERDFI